MIKKALWFCMALLSMLISLYAIVYLVLGLRFGIEEMKSEALLSNALYRIGFYTHIIFAALALLVGWVQFSSKIRNRNLKLHRAIGKIYIITALLGSMGGIYIGFYSTGGLVPAAGFISLGLFWFYSTLRGYLTIMDKKIEQHQRMMIYSYACCFAGVTLRAYQPFLIMYFGDFITAYKVVAWLCWVPNLVVASLIIRLIERSRTNAIMP
jgi:uncharacterized membrane protein